MAPHLDMRRVGGEHKGFLNPARCEIVGGSKRQQNRDLGMDSFFGCVCVGGGDIEGRRFSESGVKIEGETEGEEHCDCVSCNRAERNRHSH